MDDKRTVDKIISCLGGRENIVSVTNCMTRLRVIVKSEERVDAAGLKGTERVLGLVHDRERSYEVVVGPGNSRRFADLCHEQGLAASGTVDGGWRENKAALRAGQKKNRLREFLKVIGDIFVPLIPGIIAAGLCAGVASLITQLVPDYQDRHIWYLVYSLLTVINTAFTAYLTAWAGYRAAERFGATPILGGMLGMITSLSNIDDISRVLGLYNADSPLQSILRSGKGGVIAVICGAFVLAVIEKQVRKRMPASVDIIFTPLITLFLCTVPYILIMMPAFGYVSNSIVWVFSQACMSESAAVRLIVGFAAAALFLPLVASGMHHGLVALYSVQLQELGFVTLYPALAMAGAGQVGAALALRRKAKRLKHHKLCSVIDGALPAGFLGVGEPLIYGVTLPMGRPFITAGLGAGFGGAFVMLFQVASTTWGPSGLIGAFVMTAGPSGAVKSVIMYLIGLAVSYGMSFLITTFMISDTEVSAALGGVQNDTAEPDARMASETATFSESPAEKPHQTVRHGDSIPFGIGQAVSFEHVIRDPVGLHARPAGELCRLTEELGCEVTVRNGARETSGKSVTGLMTLGAVQGSRLEVTVEGARAREAARRLQAFLTKKL